MVFGCQWRFFRFVIFASFVFICMVVFYVPDLSTVPPTVQVEGWAVGISRDTNIYVLPENDTTLINGKEICTEENLFLVIVVCSAPENVAQRNAIRETWASHNLTEVRVAFLLGWTPNITLQSYIEEENSMYKDIVQENFIDSYNNLTVKSVMMLKWFLHQCPSPKFLMKTDDDMFVNVFNIFALLVKARTTSLLLGSLICKAKPILDTTSKWYTPKYMFNSQFYPNYLSGTGYVMSRDVAVKLYQTTLRTPLFHLEDIYITGICAGAARIQPRNHPGFTYNYLGLQCIPNQITNHRLSPEKLHIAWEQRNNCTVVTKKPRIVKYVRHRNVCR